MSKMVYVVTMPELGWDCIVAVIDSNVDISKLEEIFDKEQYVIFTQEVYNNLENWGV